MSCPVCGEPRGTNKYCWNHTNSDSVGYLLPSISDMDLIKYVPPKKRPTKHVQGTLRKEGVK